MVKRVGWHWLEEEGKMPFIECQLWVAKGLAYIILLNLTTTLTDGYFYPYTTDEEAEVLRG